MNTAPSRPVSEVFFTVLAAAMGPLFALIPYLINQRYYFIDDAQHDTYPFLFHIGQVLRDGQFPMISLGSFFTSNLLAEYQTALFNPFMLGMAYILAGIENYHVAGLVFVSFHYAVLGSGLFVLARGYGVSRPLALVLSAVILTNNFISYWYAESWLALFYTTCWMVWGWAALARAHTSRWWALAAVFLSYVTIVSGFPNTTLFLGVVALFIAFQRWRETRALGSSILVIGLMGAATFLSAIPLLAVVSSGQIAARSQETFNNGFLVPNLKDTLSLSAPFHRGQIFIYNGFRTISTPIFYCTWLLLPLLPFIAWRRTLFRVPAVAVLLGLCALLLLATLGPEQVQSLRYPFRWISYFHITLVLAMVLLLHLAGLKRPSRRRLALSAALLALQFVVSWQTTPQDWIGHGAAALISLLGIALFVYFASSATARAGVAIAVTLVFFVLTHLTIPQNIDIADWGVSEHAGDVRGAEIPPAYTAYIGDFGNVGDTRRLDEYGTGLMQLAKGVAMVNGYTPIGHRYLSTLMCMDQFGQTCPDAGPRLVATDPETGVSVSDLMRVDRLVALKGPHDGALQAALPSSWSLDSEGLFTRVYTKPLPNAQLPGTLSWVSPGLVASSAEQPSFAREELEIATGEDPGRVIFARLWWPGYRALLDGEPIALAAHLGIFVSVELPPNTQGRLTVEFLPPYLTLGIAMIVLGLLLAIGLVAVHRRLVGPRPEARPRLDPDVEAAIASL